MKTVKVRIAVAVDPDGNWNSCGSEGMDDGDMLSMASEIVSGGEVYYWLTAELPLPEVETFCANVEESE